MFRCGEKCFGRASLSLSSAGILRGEYSQKSCKFISNYSRYIIGLPDSLCFVGEELDLLQVMVPLTPFSSP